MQAASSQPPRVTALINAYNYGRFIEEAIESVLAQDFPREQMEILVVDDGSTDDTHERVARFGNRVRYLYKDNGGQASALNLGLAQAKGEIVALLDADDLWQPTKMQRVAKLFEQDPSLGMAYHPYAYWSPAKNASETDPQFRAVSGYLPDNRAALLAFGSTGTSCMALRLSVARRLLPVPERLRIYADTYLLGLMVFIAPVAGLSLPLTKYRQHGESATNFSKGDAERLRWRYFCFKAAVDEVRAWLERNGFDTRATGILEFLERHDLKAEMFRLESRGATRRELYEYLQRETRLFAPSWSWKYRVYRSLLALLAYAVGAETFFHLRDRYRTESSWKEYRNHLFPRDALGPEEHPKMKASVERSS
jgi:glycosyltransferase involved in cell wall biosynthesis